MDHYVENIRVCRNFIENMKALRKQKGLSQYKLADRLGLHPKRVGSWEEYRCFPPIEVLIQVSDFFKQDLRTMLEKRVHE